MDLMSIAQLLGNFGEFVGAIAVVITLIYLARQVQSSSEATKALVRQGINDFSLQYMSYRLDNRKIVGAYTKFRAGQALSDEETDLLTRHQQFNFLGLEGLYSNYRRGFFEESEWLVYENRVSSLLRLNPFARQFWENRSGRDLGDRRPWDPEFALRIDALLAQVQSSTE